MSKDKIMEDADTKVLERVKLNNGGLGGITVSYYEHDDRRDGMLGFKNQYKGVIFSAPVTAEMAAGFEALKGKLLDICGYPLEGDDREIMDLNVSLTGVSYESSKGFVLSGTLNVLDGSKTINLVTPLLANEEEFPGYGDIVVGIQKIYYDTKEYLSGRNRLSNLAMIEMVDKKKPIDGFDKETFSQLSYAEQMRLSVAALEGAGCAVLVPEDLEKEIEDVETPDLVNEIEQKIENKEEPKMAIESSDDDFAVDVAPQEEEDFDI